MNEIIDFIKKNYPSLIVGGIVVSLLVRFLWSFFVYIYKKICKKVSDIENYKEIQREMVSFTSQQVDRQINSKKYLPNTYIEVTALKEHLRFFCYPLLFYNKLVDELNRLDFSYINKELFSRYAKRIVIPRIRKGGMITFRHYRQKIRKVKDIVDKNVSVLNSISTDENSNWKTRQKLNTVSFKRGLLESRILLVLDDAGQGKTNLVCDLMNCFLKRLDIPSVLFFGSDFNNINDKEILGFFSAKIARRSDYDLVDRLITKVCKKRKKHFIFIIDALNECSNPNFPDILCNFITELLHNKFVKIILTCRTEYYNLNFLSLESSSFSASMKKIEGINSKLEGHEKEALFRTYLDSFHIKWSSFWGAVYERLVDNFLLLRIFCEVYQGENIGAVFNVYMLDLFDRYYRQIRVNVADYVPDAATFEKIVCNILDYMIQNKIYRDVPLQRIVEPTGVTKNIMIRLIDENVFFRRDLLNQTGVLLDVEVVSFTFDEFRDFLIADYLSNVLLRDNKGGMVKFLNEEVLPQKPLFEGVSKYLFFFSKKDQGSGLSEVLKQTSWYSDKYIQYIFQTNDDHLSDDDVSKVKGHFFTSDIEAERILKILIYYRFDTAVYKRLNITLLYDILVELNEEDFKKKFISYFSQKSKGLYYGESVYSINLAHYFDFISKQIEAGRTSDLAMELLFFLIFNDSVGGQFRKAKELFDALYQKSPTSALQIIQKYRTVRNQFIKSNADSLYKKYSRN